MAEVERTWMVLLRDVSDAVHVAGVDGMMAALVLHAETGLVLGISISGTAPKALAGAFDAALTHQGDDLPPAPPDRVVSLVEVGPEVRKALAAASAGSPELIEAGSLGEAEDIAVFNDVRALNAPPQVALGLKTVDAVLLPAAK